MDTTNIMAILADHASAIDTSWTLLGAALVFFMQAGFAMVRNRLHPCQECRQHHHEKPDGLFASARRCYWLIGFGIMFGGTGALIGGFRSVHSEPLRRRGPVFTYPDFPDRVLCNRSDHRFRLPWQSEPSSALTASIPRSSAAVVYPISGHWIWGGGWLAQLGFHDFAGSTAVHMVGGVSCSGRRSLILGPRIGKYDKNGKPKAIPGHYSDRWCALGVFILWFCWFGFNGGIHRCHDKRRISIRRFRLRYHQHGCRCCNRYGYVHHLDSLRQAGCIHDAERLSGRSGSHHCGL